MNEFQGFVRQGVARIVLVSFCNPNTGAVEQYDAAPTWRLYGPTGIILNGTSSPAQTGTITGATNANPIVITSANHGLFTGSIITVSGVVGNTAANGVSQITKIDANSFSLNGKTGNGAYVSGGSWISTGLEQIALSQANTTLLTPGETYTIEISYTVSSALRKKSVTIGCN